MRILHQIPIFSRFTRWNIYEFLIHTNILLLKWGYYYTLVAEWGTRNADFRYYLGLQQGFSSFIAIFDDFSKWSTPKALWNFEKSSNIGKKEEKHSFLKCTQSMIPSRTPCNTLLYDTRYCMILCIIIRSLMSLGASRFYS